MKVLVCDPIDEEGVALLRREGVQVDVAPHLSRDELLQRVDDYDALVVRSETRLTREVLARGKKLQVVARAGVGLDNIDVDAATRQGIIVVNAPTSNTIAAAEHTLALILALARHLPQASAELRQGRWERESFMGTELRGKTLGIVGLGRVGTEVARRAAPFQMRLLGHDPFISVEHAHHLGVELVSLQEILQRSDFVTLHVTLTSATRHLIGAGELSLMKPTARLINTSRGGVVDEEALYGAIQEGRIGGAALDVFTQEPPKPHPIFQDPRVIVTPHLAASTTEAQAGVAVDVAQGILDVFRGQAPLYGVNTPLATPETVAALAPFVPVATAVGKLASQMTEAQPRTLEITYSGELASHEASFLNAAVLRGFLELLTEERVNLVNAHLVAQSRGLHILEHKQPEAESYTNLITLDVHTSDGPTSIAGTLVRGQAHIVSVNAYSVDMVPTGGYWLVISHRDRPGMIGNIGTVTGENDINISSMQVSRQEARGPALTVLGLDEPVTERAMQLIAQIRDIHKVRLIRV
ncbi:MAG: phosphoglycerate dehydrogenase [Chloroflexi bacterium]|nr:phosphoglycerate dehydrogenase [Chloroflexota bacterium]